MTMSTCVEPTRSVRSKSREERDSRTMDTFEGADVIALLDHLGLDQAHLFLGGVGGADVMARLERVLPEGAGRMALADVPAEVECLDVADSGDFVQVEQPEQVAAGLADFLSRPRVRT